MKPMVEGHTREECSGATADDARGTIWDLGCDQWAHMPDRLVGGGVDAYSGEISGGAQIQSRKHKM